eukprot:CAMPEP_0170079638 /NCGR_PEP_ID=MMETSP0019_2-20121128/15963_1 /TAXON_ID=98059 /ORGANISM="Dinobryon sp., Strain UTEXLB2267" /LENGTH=228 /DNA_ID=CAMNT_0010293183 /DNA_START=57 /DNA_END=743 /DNA_ORIENTATION=-
MTVLRDKNTSATDFRKILREITFYLGYEASRDLQLTEEIITTPTNTEFKGSKIGEKIALVPILRAGLSMADGMLELFPRAVVHHIGMYRAKDSLLPIQYYNKLPKLQACDVAYVLDPSIATSNTIIAVVSLLKRWGAKKIIVLAAIGARAGVQKLLQTHPTVAVHLGAMDEFLSPEGTIIPGIGDAGDRQFGTMDEAPILSPMNSPVAKRKRSSNGEEEEDAVVAAEI